jgi:hypothetical protein
VLHAAGGGTEAIERRARVGGASAAVLRVSRQRAGPACALVSPTRARAPPPLAVRGRAQGALRDARIGRAVVLEPVILPLTGWEDEHGCAALSAIGGRRPRARAPPSGKAPRRRRARPQASRRPRAPARAPARAPRSSAPWVEVRRDVEIAGDAGGGGSWAAVDFNFATAVVLIGARRGGARKSTGAADAGSKKQRALPAGREASCPRRVRRRAAPGARAGPCGRTRAPRRPTPPAQAPT